MQSIRAAVFILAVVFVVATDSAAGPPVQMEWRFAATLDGSPIGEHTFRVREEGGEIQVDSRAVFDVRFFGLSLYTYEHHARERWSGGCLATLESRTDDNGKAEVVRGELAGDGFALTRGELSQLLPACTFTFAYWNPAMRAQQRLLNPQTGEYLNVDVSSEGIATMAVGESSQAATKYVVRGNDLEIALWHDAATGRWIGLDSKTARGGVISYRLSE
jgi:hypothetical protein